MILKIRNGVIYRMDYGVEHAIGTLFDAGSDEEEKIIECGSEIIPIVEDFIKQVNTGSFKPRKVVKEFEKILDKYEIKPNLS